jgi:kynurenine formamidase
MNFESLLADRGYEFIFVFTPLRLTGATGSPGRPIAIR